jgi:hypothetical protein
LCLGPPLLRRDSMSTVAMRNMRVPGLLDSKTMAQAESTPEEGRSEKLYL